MKKDLTKAVIFSVSVLVAVGACVGAYFGMRSYLGKNNPTSSATSSEPAASSVTAEIPEAVKTMFASDSPSSATALSGFSSSYINSAYSVTLADSTVKAFYYDLTSAKGYKGTLEFAIGVKDGVVSYYHYLKNISEHDWGNTAASGSTTLFVGFSLTNEDIAAGMTTSYTYAGMKTAVIAALNDAAGR
jgi:uncharacterized protein with FMN-binding domain